MAINFNDNEKVVLGEFISTALAQQQYQTVIDTFVGILSEDPQTVAFIKAQISGYLQMGIDSAKTTLAGIDQEKAIQAATLQGTISLLQGLQVKLS